MATSLLPVIRRSVSPLLLVAALAGSAAEAQVSVLPGPPELSLEVLGATNPGVPVLVLNGGPGLPHDYMVPEWSRLAENRRLIFFDQRGCGRSGEAEDYSWQAYVGDLQRVVDATTPGQVVLAGSSWGATLALLYASQFPDRIAAIILSGLPFWPDRALRVPPVDSDPRGESYPNNRVVRVSPQTENSEAILLGRIEKPCPAVRNSVWKSMGSAPSVGTLASIAAPVLLIRGVPSDQPDGAVQVRRVLPNLRMLTVLNGGHDPWFVAPSLVFPEILPFLATSVP